MTERIATAPDGAEVRGFEEGDGPPVLVLHPGMDDGASWDRVSARLRRRFRVVRLHRRTYRPDLDPDPAESMAQEAEDVAAAARALGGRVLLVGHSSGAVVGLEALTAFPDLFSGAVLYEPPAPVAGLPLGGEGLRKAKAHASRNRPGRAITVFMREVVGYPPWLARVFGLLIATVPGLGGRVSRQLVDCEAIDRTGVRTEAYAGIRVPVLFLLGGRSPANLHGRTEALRDAIPGAHVVPLPGQEHTANRVKPGWIAQLVGEFADVLDAPGRDVGGQS